MTATRSYGCADAFLTEQVVSAPMLMRLATPRSLLTDPPARTFDVHLAQLTMTIKLTGEEPDWLYGTIQTMQHLSRLPANWSSYGSRRIEDVALIGAARMLASLLGPQSAPPSVVPTLHGGVQLAWHRNGTDVELEFSPDGAVSYVYTYDRPTDVTWEPEAVTADVLQRLRTMINRLGQH